MNWLAEKGSQGQVGTHSHRWAAPHQMALTQEKAERCRKCGRLFRDARKCAAHEKGCDGENEVLGTEQLCRKCGAQFKDRKQRDTHEVKCTGNALDNLKCKIFAENFS